LKRPGQFPERFGCETSYLYSDAQPLSFAAGKWLWISATLAGVKVAEAVFKSYTVVGVLGVVYDIHVVTLDIITRKCRESGREINFGYWYYNGHNGQNWK
jgi:hypothetical protein